MKQTELEKAICELVSQARAHSQIMIGEDAVNLPDDFSMLPLAEQVGAVTEYLLQSC